MLFVTKIKILLFCSFVKYSQNQYMSLNQRLINPTHENNCENSPNMVEHFFNLVFTEFHNTPPACVCVQMCQNQPTYCYPNGCIRRNESKKKHVEKALSPVIDNKEVGSRPLLFVEDDRSNFMTQFIEEGNVAKPVSDYEEKYSIDNLRPDSFTNRYKTLLNYKKIPKIELKYMLREQQHTNSDIIENSELSRTKWSQNRLNQLYSQSQKNYNDRDTPKFFLSVNPEHVITNYTSRYFKRELASGEQKDEVDTIDFSAKESKTSNKYEIHSLEELIESLSNNFSQKNNNETNLIMKLNDNTTTVQVTSQNFTFEVKKKNITNKEAIQEMSSIPMIKSVNRKKYQTDTYENFRNLFNRMFSKVSKQVLKPKILNSTGIHDNYKNRFNDMITTLATKLEKGINTTEKLSNRNLSATSSFNSTDSNVNNIKTNTDFVNNGYDATKKVASVGLPNIANDFKNITSTSISTGNQSSNNTFRKKIEPAVTKEINATTKKRRQKIKRSFGKIKT